MKTKENEEAEDEEDHPDVQGVAVAATEDSGTAYHLAFGNGTSSFTFSVGQEAGRGMDIQAFLVLAVQTFRELKSSSGAEGQRDVV